MAFQAHSETQYLIGMHWYLCAGESIKEAARKANMNPTVLWRACTGWTGHDKGGGKRDGDAGRAMFLRWLKGARSHADAKGEGTPCCGGHIIAGKRSVPRLGKAEEHLAARRELEAEIRKKQAEIERLLAKAGVGPKATHAGDEPPADELEA